MKRALLIVSCLVLGGLAVSLFVPARRTPPPRVTFSGGQSAILRKLTYGTNHQAPPSRGWTLPLARLARAWGGSGRPRTSPAPFKNLTTAEPSLVLWIENTESTNWPPVASRPAWLMVADETGHAAGKRLLHFGGSSAKNSTVALTTWPRSSRKLIFRWFEEGGLAGEWVAPNPAYQPPANWVAETLPQTRTNGSLRCALERAVVGLSTPGAPTSGPNGRRLHFGLAERGQEPGAALVFRLTPDLPGEEWEVGSVRLRDVSGNEMRHAPLRIRVEKTCCSFTPALWFAGPWEIRIFAKQPVPPQLPVSDRFSPEEVLVFNEVEVTDSGDLSAEQERNGARLRLKHMTLRPAQDPTTPWNTEDVSELRATWLHGLDGPAHVDLAGVTDAHGKTHYHRAYGNGSGGVSRDLELHYSFPTLSLDARKLTITFVVQRGREFMFRVKPELPTSPVDLP